MTGKEQTETQFSRKWAELDQQFADRRGNPQRTLAFGRAVAELVLRLRYSDTKE